MGSSELQQAMVPKAGTPDHSYYGLATMNLTGLFGGGSGSPPAWGSYGHLGDTYGFSGVAMYFPREEMAIAVASNVEGGQGDIITAICGLYNRMVDEVLSR